MLSVTKNLSNFLTGIAFCEAYHKSKSLYLLSHQPLEKMTQLPFKKRNVVELKLNMSVLPLTACYKMPIEASSNKTLKDKISSDKLYGFFTLRQN